MYPFASAVWCCPAAASMFPCRFDLYVCTKAARQEFAMVVALLLFTYDTTQASMPRVALPKSYHVKSAPCKTLGRAMNGWNSSPATAIWPEWWPWLSTKPFVLIWWIMTRKHIGGLTLWTLPTLQGLRSLVSFKYISRYGPPNWMWFELLNFFFLGHKGT